MVCGFRKEKRLLINFQKRPRFRIRFTWKSVIYGCIFALENEIKIT